MIRFSRTTSLVAALGVAGIVIGSSVAFTASNTVEASKAGSGSGTISGYAVTNVDYTLDATTPSNIASVAFRVTGDVTGHQAYVKLVAAGGTWFSCTLSAYDSTGGYTPVSCTTTGTTASSADSLTVSIAQ